MLPRGRRCLAATLALTLAGVGALRGDLPRSASASADPITAYVQAAMRRLHVPGLALLVARDGKVVRAEGYGIANLEHRVAVKPETIFQSGSVGKQFTATAVMQLVEDGKVRLDDPITDYLGEAPSAWASVSVRQLLSHTAGFGDYTSRFDMRRDYDEEQLLQLVKATPLEFRPGQGWKYSNLGYVALGIMIHRVSGKFYGDFLQERVFRPLGMTTARVISEADIVPDRAAGYVWAGGGWKNQDWVSPTLNTTADGSLYVSILDLAKWDAALYGKTMLKRSSLAQMWTVAKLANGEPNAGEYGFGWFVHQHDGRRLLEHDGEWQGFSCHIARYVDDRLTVAVLTNLGNAAAGDIAHGVAELVLQGHH